MSILNKLEEMASEIFKNGGDTFSLTKKHVISTTGEDISYWAIHLHTGEKQLSNKPTCIGISAENCIEIAHKELFKNKAPQLLSSSRLGKPRHKP